MDENQNNMQVTDSSRRVNTIARSVLTVSLCNDIMSQIQSEFNLSTHLLFESSLKAWLHCDASNRKSNVKKLGLRQLMRVQHAESVGYITVL